jgi:hypothetical protein
MAEIALSIVTICFPLFRIFEAHSGSNIRKGGKQKYRRDQKISGVFFAMAEKTRDMLLHPINVETTDSAGRFPPDLFCTIDPWHGLIVRKRFGTASRRIGKKTTKKTDALIMVDDCCVVCVIGSGGRTVRHSTYRGCLFKARKMLVL